MMSPRAVLQRIPGWELASYRELDGGQTNQNWLIEVDGRKGVLKIDPKLRTAPFNDRRDEARIQQLAAARGLANAVLYADDNVYLTEFVAGDVWSAAHFAVDNNLRVLAAAVRDMHALPLTGRVFDAAGAAERYLANISGADTQLARRYTDDIHAMQAPNNLCCCHNDLVAENILATGTLRFLDWEYAADNDPLFDLATVTTHHRLSNRQTDLFLDAYFDGNGARRRQALAEQARLYEALNWLWSHSRP